MSGDDDDDFSPEPGPTEQPTVDAASATTLRKARRTKRGRQREADEFWNAVFDSEIGRREMWGLLSAAHPFDTRFGATPAGFAEERATWVYHGEQQLGLRMFLTWQHLYPEGVRMMIAENDPRFATRKRDGNG